MSQIKTAILSVVAVAGITAAVFEHLNLERLRVENRDLLAKARQFASLQAENERLAKAAGEARLSPLSDEQRAELLRLRGEVGRLRDNLRAAQASPSTRTIPGSTETNAASAAPQPFTTSLTARLRDGETIITGGWSTAVGSHTFILLTPKIDVGDGGTTQAGDGANAVAVSNGKVTVNATTADIPDELLAQFGLDQFKADGHESAIQDILSETDAQALLEMLNNPPDGVWVSHSRITTSDGVSASLSMIPDASSNDPQLQVGLTPSFTPDKSAVDLAINEQVVRSKP